MKDIRGEHDDDVGRRRSISKHKQETGIITIYKGDDGRRVGRKNGWLVKISVK